jgi:hypothetical protein
MRLACVLVLILSMAGCTGAKIAARPVSLFEAHCRLCPQCNRPIMTEDGVEQSLCDAGFEAFKADVRRANGTYTSGTGAQ